MDMAKSLEIFHRLNYSNEVMPAEEFEARKKKFCSMDLTKEERLWIFQKLEHANEPNLKKRLEALVKDYSFPYFEKREPNKRKFCVTAANCRNYYTHFNPKRANKALKGKQLFDLSENLKLLLISALLQGVNIPISAMEEALTMLIY